MICGVGSDADWMQVRLLSYLLDSQSCSVCWWIQTKKLVTPRRSDVRGRCLTVFSLVFQSRIGLILRLVRLELFLERRIEKGSIELGASVGYFDFLDEAEVLFIEPKCTRSYYC